MESELEDMNPDPSKLHPLESQPEPAHDDASTKDDRPLLKSDANRMSSSESIEELEKKFAAFVRNDVYGTMGRGELPLVEKFLLGISLVTLLPIRVVLAMIILLFYYTICRICTLFSAPNRDEERSRRISRIWEGGKGRDCKNEGRDQSAEPERPGAIISNHISYLDILYHMSSSFPSFVAKRSVAKLPLVGLISKCLGCVYVQRESKSSDFKGVAGLVTERVREAYQNRSAPTMMLFPEGTTTNGDFLLPFKTGAFLAGVPVLPVILRYPYQRFSPAWDSISGVRHVIFLLCQFINYIEVKRLPVYYPSQEEKDDPKLYACNVRRLMAHEGDLVMSDIGLAEKRVYHAALNGNNSLPSVLHQKDD
ncbi:hypothetical protein GH714_005906 [Hevea brasiliensis]|uniref:Phospholipid/glycerol acyltransferase domain-containing protein n=1 Tax=Hevea brasiliensis TaxID=3981 RepID=A0A6A6LIG7_HEVBR|nr:hypothetical protein GH714_005906 [Hevea brasiliensis]